MNRSRWAWTLSVATFAALVAAFLRDAGRWAPRRPDLEAVVAKYGDPSTVRAPRKAMELDGTPCSSCHDGSESIKSDPKRKGTFHEAVVLRHGRNERCFNCHDRARTDTFVNFDGSPIVLKDSVLLCARCHGPTYRDWKMGAHGRRTGSWQAKEGPQYAVCIACHDPHAPAFRALTAAPPPRVNPRDPRGGLHE